MQRGLFASVLAVPVVAVAACSDRGSVISPGQPPPPSPDLRATSLDTAGSLRITVTAFNQTHVHLHVAASPQCPFSVTMFRDLTGQYMLGSGTTIGACSSSVGTTDLAPGDSLSLTRLFSANDLRPFTEGTYGVRVTVGTGTAMTTAWGGAVRLPLNSVVPLPPGDGPLTGTWMQPSVDTWVQLDLSQSGSRVVGYYREGSGVFGGLVMYPISITGTAALPQATLQWIDAGLTTMNATLSADGESLTGTWSAHGQPAVPFRFFQRSK
jgi:hypothetical protein